MDRVTTESSTVVSEQLKRTDRVSCLIQRILAEVIQQEVKDPRFPRLVTISAVNVSPDLKHARVYITAWADLDKKGLVVSLLQQASGYLRTALARRIKLRVVPELHFVYDESIERASRIHQLIDSVYERAC